MISMVGNDQFFTGVLLSLWIYSLFYVYLEPFVMRVNVDIFLFWWFTNQHEAGQGPKFIDEESKIYLLHALDWRNRIYVLMFCCGIFSIHANEAEMILGISSIHVDEIS